MTTSVFRSLPFVVDLGVSVNCCKTYCFNICTLLCYFALFISHFNAVYLHLCARVKVILKSTIYSQTLLINVLLSQPTLPPVWIVTDELGRNTIENMDISLNFVIG